MKKLLRILTAIPLVLTLCLIAAVYFLDLPSYVVTLLTACMLLEITVNLIVNRASKDIADIALDFVENLESCKVKNLDDAILRQRLAEKAEEITEIIEEHYGIENETER